MSQIVNYIRQHNLAKKGFKILDLGGRDGIHSLPFIKDGCEVTIVDRKILANKRKGLIKQKMDIRDFKYNGKYDLILINNVLPFLKGDEVLPFIENAHKHLKKGGVLEFTLFGVKHAWFWEPHIFFHDQSFIKALKKKYKVIFFKEEEGDKITLVNDKVYWHNYELWIKK